MKHEKVIPNNTFLSTPAYLTTPIFYPSGRPHIGHAYTLYITDTLARLHRQAGQAPTLFITGTDEHGQKLQRVAEQHGVTPEAWVQQNVNQEWLPLLTALNVSNNDFIRTTQPRHIINVQNFITNLHEHGYIYKGVHQGFYCIDCEEKKTASELLDPQDGTTEKLCAIHKRPVQVVAEENYFFRLSSFTKQLRDLLTQNPDFIQPASARNEVLSLLEAGLEDLSITRTNFTWGIPTPWDTEHIIYVWFDALLNYLSALGYNGVADHVPSPYNDAIHIIGKDILRFHAIVLPALLLAHNLGLPRQVIVHGWLLNRGEKIAKSSGNAQSPVELLQTTTPDALRYHLLRTIPLGKDGVYSDEELAVTYTTFLANNYGNLASRLNNLLRKNSGAVIPPRGTEQPADLALHELTREAHAQISQLKPLTAISILITQVEQLCQATNLYLTEQEPWRLARDSAQHDRVQEILGTATHAFLTAARLAAALLPDTTDKVSAAFGVDLAYSLGPLDVAGSTVREIQPLFPRR